MKNKITVTFIDDPGNIEVSNEAGEICNDTKGNPLIDYDITTGTDLDFYAYTIGNSLSVTVTIEIVSGPKDGRKETFTNILNGNQIYFPSVAGKIQNYRSFGDFVKEIKEEGGIPQ